ncbi:MAG TPA: hypothetical protein VIV60_33010 [Polyangiaceae bacterium]
MSSNHKALAYLGCAASLVFASGTAVSAPVSNADPLLSEFSRIVEETCACKNPQCAEAANAKFEAFSRRIAAAGSKPSDAQTKGLQDLNRLRGECREKVFLAGGPPSTTRPSKREVLVPAAHSCVVETNGGDTFFVDEASALKAVSLATGKARELVPATQVRDIAVSGNDVYYVVGNAIWRVARQGGKSTLLINTSSQPAFGSDSTVTGLAADANFVYWSDQTGVHRIRKSGGAPSNVTTAVSADGFFMDDKSVYYFTVNELAKVPKGGGAPTKLMDSATRRKTALPNGADWLWMSRSKLVPKGDYLYGRGSACGVFRIPKNGGAPTLLVESDAQCGKGLYISVGDTVVFENAGPAGTRLLEVALKGGAPVQITATTNDICAIAHRAKSLVVGSPPDLWKIKR